MRNLGKVLRSSTEETWEATLTEFLRNYRATPHAATGAAPSRLLFKGQASTAKLPTSYNYNTNYNANYKDHNGDQLAQARAKDTEAKSKAAAYNNNTRKAREHSFKIGDLVLLKQRQLNKSMPPFDPEPYTITEIRHSMAVLVFITLLRQFI